MTEAERCAWDRHFLAWEVLTLGWNGPGIPSPSKSSPTPSDVPSSRAIGPTSHATTTSALSTGANGSVGSTSSAVGSPAKTSPSQEGASEDDKGWRARGPLYGGNFSGLQMTLLGPVDSFWSRTSLASCPRTVAAISPSFSRPWPKSGFATSPGAFWTVVSSECPNGGGECSSLADVVGAIVAPRFYLSPKAAAGILRRAERRRRGLPGDLTVALRELARDRASDTTPTPTISSSPLTDAEAAPTTTRPKVDNSSSVRRLTPTECERLQGFPDGWTIHDQTDAAMRRSVTP